MGLLRAIGPIGPQCQYSQVLILYGWVEEASKAVNGLSCEHFGWYGCMNQALLLW